MQGKYITKMMISQWVKRNSVVFGSIVLLIIYQCIQIFRRYMSYKVVGEISFFNVYLIAIGFIMIQGIIHSYHDYGGYLGINAQRNQYLINIIVVGIVGSLCLMSMLYTLDFTSRKIIDCVMYQNKNKIHPMDITLQFMWGISLFAYCIGFFIGALCYRMRKSIALGLIAIVPIGSVLIILVEAIFQNPLTSILFNMVSMLILMALKEWGQLIYSVILLIGASLLLRHAPANHYKHDLI